MPTITVSLPNDGETIDASDYNVVINAILSVLNGGLDADNMANGSISNAKYAAASIDVTKVDATVINGYAALSAQPNTITYLGNRLYTLLFNSLNLSGVLSPGMKLKLTRAVTALTQSASLNGSSQYFFKSSPGAMTFTDDFTVSAWVKLNSYNGALNVIASRYNGTSGWDFGIDGTTGQVYLRGFNAGSSNLSQVASAQGIPLNTWVHVSAQLDMSSFTNSATTSYVMINGVDTTGNVTRSGTNPTALTQAGNLEIGSRNGGSGFFNGKLAQVAIYNSKVTQANIIATMSQTLLGTETNLVSAYSLSGLVTDLVTGSANNLTAQASAVTTNADSPYAGGSNATGGYAAGTTEFAEVFDVAFSTNTTVTVMVPDGYLLPTTGGVTGSAYATTANPLGAPASIKTLGVALMLSTQTSTTSSTPQGIPGVVVPFYVPKGRKVKANLINGIGIASSGAAGTGVLNGICADSISGTSRISQSNTNSGGIASVVTFDAAIAPPHAPTPGNHTYYGIFAGDNGGHTTSVTGDPISPVALIIEFAD